MRVSAEDHRPARARPPPQTLFSKRKLPVCKCHAHIGIQQLEMVYLSDWYCRRHRSNFLSLGDHLARGRRQRWGRWCVLILSVYVYDKARLRRPSRESSDIVKSFLIGPTKVVDDGLTEVVVISVR